MLFITNRILKNMSENRVDFVLDDNSASHSVCFCERTGKGQYTELGSQVFLKRLKDSNSKQILLYIHGFSNLPESDIFHRAKALQKMCDAKEKGLVEVVSIIWPCDNDMGIIKDYWDDQKAADASKYAFSRALEKFMAWRGNAENESVPCLKRINILAHSMGNRVLKQTIGAWAEYYQTAGVPMIFRNVFLVAADIVNESLENRSSGGYICDTARNVVVYYASDDLALRSSKISNLKNKVASRRLGHTGPENMKKVPQNVYAIDCDDVNTQYDHPMGHSYFLYKSDNNTSGIVFDHIFVSIQNGRIQVDNEYRRTHILKEG